MINRILYIAVLLLGFVFKADAQCGNDNTYFTDLTPVGCPGTNSTTCIFGGEYVTVDVIAGNDYTFSTCGDTDFDTQITLYNGPSVVVLGYNDDDPACGLQSTINWTATFTGTVWVMLDMYLCGNAAICMDLNITCSTSGGCGGGPVCTGPAADACATACNLGSLTAPTPCPAGTGTAQTWCGTNTGATADNPYTYQLGCVGGGDMPISVPDVWYTFTPTGNSIDISVAGLTNPSIGLWSGNCAGLAGIGCANGAGTANLLVEPVIPGNTYYLQISGGSVGDVGDFDLSITNSFNCDICLTEASITANPAPTNGFYQNNETVTFCYDLVTWEQQLINWLHGVQVSFGPGWDQSTLTTNPPAAQGGNGTWSWYNSSIVSEAGNGTFPPGFYFESPSHSGGANDPTDPGDSWGDNGTGGWQFCWTITTQDCPPGVDGADLGISVTTTADGESGDWTSYACSPDPSVDFNGIMTCCPDPILQALTGNACFSDCLGSATVIGDGTGPYDYSWVQDSNGATVYTDNGNAGASTATNLCSGDYTVTVVDQFNGCTADLTVTITAPPALVLNQISLTNETCGTTNGQIVVSASGGTPGYTYDIGGASQASGTFSGLSSGPYTVTVTDGGSCTEQLVINIANDGGPTANITSQFDPTCNGGNNGSFTIVGSGSLAPYTYSIDGVNFGGSGTFTGQAAGTYTITVQDAYSCQTTINVTLNEPPILVLNVVSIVDASCGLTNGEIHLSGSGGTPPYSFNIGSGAQASGDFTGLSGGVYTATLSDGNGCVVLLPVTVNAGSLVANITSQTNILCFGGSGSITVTASGSLAPYSFDIGSGPQAGGTFAGLGPGSYTITVEDGVGCQLPVNFTITEPNVLTGSINTQSNITCNGDDDGSVTVGGWGGTPSYQYNIGSGNQTSGTFSGLSPNNYTVVVTDANGCTFPVPVNITEPFVFVLVENDVIDATCELNNGEIQVQAWGGTLPITFEYGSGWQSGNPHTISGLAPGTYTVNALDGNGCTDQVTSTVLNIDEPTISISSQSDPTCAGVADGSLVAVGADGVGPYTYSVDGVNFQASGTFLGLVAGSYTVTVEDFNGCQVTAIVTLIDPPGVNVSIASITHISCFGLSDGATTISAVGGTAPLTFDIGSGPQAGGTFSGLAAGSYTVTVLDLNNCPATINVSINEPPVLAGNLDATTDADCNGASTGSLTVSGSGGTPTYTYDIGSGAQATGVFTDLAAGNYTITIEDSEGCQTTVAATINESAILVLSQDAVTDASCGNANGEIQVSAAGGTPVFSYDLGTGPQASGTFSLLTAGSYTITVTDGSGCTDDITVTVADLSGLTASITSQTDADCNGASTGDMTVAASGSTAPYTYAIDGITFGASGTFTGLAAGPYTVTAQDAGGCLFPVAVTILEPTIVVGSLDATTDADCNGASTGDATVSASGGTSPFTFDIGSGPQVSGTFTGLAAGSYTVTALDLNGCPATINVTINEPPVLAGNLDATTDADCNGASTGSLTVSGSGGSPIYTFDIGSGPQAGGTFTGLAAGAYTITVEDVNGCQTTVNGTINEPPVLAGNLDATTDADCNGASTGSLTVSGSGGTPTYTYDIGSGAQASGTFTGLAEGAYTITVEDVNGCQTTVNGTISEPAILVISQDAVTDASCGNANGEVQVSAAGGTPVYSYDLGTGPQASGTFSLLTAGLYTITVTDGSGCTDDITVTVADLSGLTASITSQTDADCNGASTGDVTVAASGSTAPYTYAIDGITFGASGTFTGLVAGPYTVTAQDAGGCLFPVAVTILEPTIVVGSLDATTDADCNGASTGSLSVSGSGGTPTYTYDIGSGPQVSGTFTGLAAGAYTITVEDVNGCQTTVNGTVNEPAILVLSQDAVTDASCGNANGEIQVSAAGGTPMYSYDIGTGPQASGTFSSLAAGSYTITVTDANGCTDDISVTVADLSGLTASITSQTDADCNGAATGDVTVAASGSTAPYTYAIDGITFGASGTFTGLAAGPYTITAQDANGCLFPVAVTILEPTPVVGSLDATTDTDCNGASTGDATVSASGGAPPYTFDIGSGPQAAGTFTGLAAGSYTVTVLDANSCPATINVTINEPPVLAGNLDATTDADCNGASTGSLTVSGSSGTPTYTYDIGFGAQASGTFTGLSAGLYTITIEDVNSCQTTVNATINEPTILVLSEDAVTDASCGNANGEIQVSAVGGTPVYSYDIGTGPQASGIFSSLTAGSYTITVTDANGCTDDITVTVADLSGLTASITSQTDADCNGAATGDATISASGSTAPYTYAIDGITFVASGTFTGLAAGPYTVTAQDANGCLYPVAVTILEPTTVVGSLDATTDADCNGASTGDATVSASSGTPPYTFDIGSGPQAGGTFTSLAAGAYTVTVLDANSCPATINVTINEPPVLSGNLDATTDADCNGASTGSLTVSGSGGTPTYSYDIGSGAQASGTFTGMAAGAYTITVEDVNGCQTTVNATINEPAILVLSQDAVTDASCGDANGEIQVSSAGGTPAYSYDIGSGPQASGTFSSLTAGSYTITVTDANGCTDDITVIVADLSGLTASITSQTDADCNGAATGDVTVAASGSTAPYTYAIDGITFGASGTFAGLAAGPYTVTAQDANGCLYPVLVTISEPPILSGNIVAEIPTDCFGAATGSGEVEGTGGTTPYTYDIGSGAQASGVFSGLAAGVYSINIVDANGCIYPININITEPSEVLPTVASQTDPTCFAGVDGTFTISGNGGTPPYTFDIGTGPQANGTFAGLIAGIYSVDVLDANGCLGTTSVTLGEPTSVLGNLDSQTDASCSGMADASMVISGSGGTPPFTFDIGFGPQASGTFTGLTSGTYTVTIADAVGCTGTLQVDLYEPISLTASLVSTSDAACYQGADGSLEVTAQDGTGPYSFDIGNGPQASGVFNGLTAGAYSVTAMDVNGCSVQVAATINEPLELIGAIDSQTDPDCNGASTGSALVSASGGTGPYTFDMGSGPQATGNFPGLAAGTHTVTIIDANLCLITIDITLIDPTLVVIGILSQGDPLCWSGTDGQVEFDAQGGTGPYSYDIGSGSQPNGTFTGLSAGLYTVDVLDAAGCAAQTDATLNEPTDLTGSIDSQVDVSCSGMADGSVVVLGADGTPGYTYDIGLGSQPTGVFNGLTAGNYTVTITDANGCTEDVQVNITEPISLTAAIQNQTDVSCFEGSNGTVDITAQDGTQPYTFDIGTGLQPTGSFIGLAAGQYSVTVMDASGCSVQVPVVIIEPTELLGSFVSQTNLTCNASGDGLFEVSASDATPVYTFDIGSGPQANGVFSGLPAGLQTVTIIDANSCQTTIDVTLTEPTVVSSLIVSQTDPLCNGGLDGEFEVSASGGTPNYTYDIGNGSQPTGLFQNNGVGTYTVDILDANGCSDQINVTLTEPITLSGAITAQVDVSCAGFGDGSVSVSGSDGTPPYMYDIGTGPQANGDFIGLFTGPYTVTITDANGCTFDVPVLIIEPFSLSASILVQTEVTCYSGSDAMVEITAQDGTSPYIFDIGLGPQATGIFNGLATGGYTVTVADQNGCSVQVPVTIIEPDELIGSIDNVIDVSCFGGVDGEISTSALGGITPYSYDIGSGGQVNGTFSGLNAGLYSIDITDANGCVVNLQPTVIEPTQLQASIASQVEVSCFGTATGSVSISAQDGTSPYTFDIGSGPQANGTFTGLVVGNYTVTVTDDHSCSVDVQVTITEPMQLSGSIIDQVNVLCSGTATGEVTVSGSGGTVPYTYDIGNGFQPTGAFINLAVGPYQVVIEDALGCQFTIDIDITEPNPLLGVNDAQVDVSCFGISDGEVVVSVSGGTAPYSFDIGSGGQANGTFTGLSAGIYTVEITDMNGCTFDVPVTITEPQPLAGSVDDQTGVTCTGGADGTATIVAIGGTLPYIFDIGSGPQGTGIFTGLSAGVYTIQIVDAHLCTFDVGLTISEPTQLVASMTSSTDALCNGDANGGLVFLASGAVSPYTYDIGNGPQNVGVFNGLLAGNYTCTVIDANGCMVSASANVVQPDPLGGVLVDVTDALCFGYFDGSILVDATGGTGFYTFDIGSGPQLFGAFSDLPALDYEVVIVDQNLCQDTLDISVGEPPILEANVISITNVLCAGEADGAFEIEAFGGSPDYVYSIGGGAMPTGLFTGLFGGIYDVLITDEHTCQLIVEVEIEAPAQITIAIGTPISTFCAGQEISLSTSVAGGVLPYTFEWFEVIGTDTNSVSTDSIPVLTLSETAIYFLEATDANNCSVTSFDVLINVHPPLELSVVSPIDGAIAVCPGDEVPIVVTGSGGNGSYTYFSMPDHVEITGFPTFYAALADSILVYQVEDGCTVEPGIATIDVTLYDIPVVQISSDLDEGCPPLEVNFSDATNPGLDQLFWNFGDGTPTGDGLVNVNHIYESSGFFEVVVSGFSMEGCPVSGTFTDFIEVWPTPDANFAVTADTVTLFNATIGFTDQSIFNIESWFWEFDDGEVDVVENPTHVYQDTGTYVVHLEVYNNYGCWDTINHMIVVIPEFAFWVPNAFTPDDDDLNETFAGEGDGVDWDIYEMNIYDRWGELIYKTTDQNAPWDGYYKGELVEMGVYVYTIKLAEIRGEKHYYTGQFTVLR